MTQSTEQERAEVIYTDQGINVVKDHVLMAFIPWEQAARRAQVVPDALTSEMSDAGLNAYNQCTSPFRRSKLAAAFYAMLAAAPQPPEEGLKREKPTSKPEAAPVQMPEPVAYLYHDAPTLEDFLANERAGIPINSACFCVRRMSHCRNETPLYTEHQVRQLLAAHGVK